jgi:hypothetical protein
MDILNINATQNALLIHWEYKENVWIYLTNKICMQMTPLLFCYVVMCKNPTRYSPSEKLSMWTMWENIPKPKDLQRNQEP